MRKLLLLLLTFNLGLNAQVLSLDDHSNLTIGNIGTDITGIVPGQDGYLTYSLTTTPVTANSNFQIVDKAGIYGNAIQITGSANSQGSRVLNKTNLQSLWSTRNAGNDIIEVEFDFYLGPATTSRNSFKIMLYTDEAIPRVLAGMFYNRIYPIRSGIAPNITVTNYTDILGGISFNNSTPESYRSYINAGLASTTPQEVIINDSWVKLGFSYNKLTGQTKWKGAGINGATTIISSSFAANLVPSKLVIKVDTNNFGQVTDGGTPPIVLYPAILNTASATFAFDNIKISATSVDNLLGSDSFDELKDGFKVFPNPANCIISVSNNENATIDKISITDVNGRIVKTENFVNISNIEVNVSDLNNGLYFMNIYSSNGLTTKKIIKN